MIDKKLNKVLVCILMGDYRELEWVIPIIHSYKQMGKHVSVLLSNRALSERNKIMLNWLKYYSDEVVYGDKIYTGQHTKDIFIYILLQRLIAILHFRKKKVFTPLYTYFTQRALVKYLKNLDIIYIPQTWLLNEPPKNNLFACLLNAGKYLNKPFVGFVFDLYAQNDSKYLPSLNNIHTKAVHTVLSNEQKRVYDQAGLNSVVIGAQRFYKAWIEEIKKYFSICEKANHLKSLINNKSVALVLLKGRSGYASMVFTENERYQYRQKLFKTLLDNGFYLIIKPHPGESEKILYNDTKDLPSEGFCISELPAQYLATISNCGVLEFPSNSVMDILAANKPAYWPLEKLTRDIPNINGDKVFKIFPENILDIFMELVNIEIPEISKLKNNIISRKEIDSEINLIAAIKECENLALI